MNEPALQPTEGEWNFYDCGVDDKGERDAGIVSTRGYAVVRCPRYQTREQWKADAKLIIQSKNMASLLLECVQGDYYVNIEQVRERLLKMKTVLKEAGVYEGEA